MSTDDEYHRSNLSTISEDSQMRVVERLDDFLIRLRAKNLFLGWFLTVLCIVLFIVLFVLFVLLIVRLRRAVSLLVLAVLLLPSLRHWMFEISEPSKCVRMGYNRVWYVLLCATVFLGLISIFRFEYETLRLIFRRWTWTVFLSPSAYLFFGSVIQAIDLPIRGMRFIPVLFDP